MTVKIASSIDDVVWLATFLTPNEGPARVMHTLIYVAVCLVQTCIAIVLARGGEVAINDVIAEFGLKWSADKVLTLAAGGVLSIYTMKLGKEYYEELNEVEDKNSEETEADNQELGYQAAAASTESQPSESPSTGLIEKTADTVLSMNKNNKAPSPMFSVAHLQALGFNSRARKLAVIAFLGSIDDLTLFTPMLAGKAFGIPELLVGGTISALLIVLLCIFITQAQPVADFLEKIPLVAIVALFASILLFQGITMK